MFCSRTSSYRLPHDTRVKFIRNESFLKELTRYEIHFVPKLNSFWYYEKGILGTEHFWGRGRLRQITFFLFFSLGGKPLFLGADRGGEGDRKWVRMLVVPFRGQRNQRHSWYVLGCFSLNKTPEISTTRTILMIWLEHLEHIDQGIFICGIFQFFAFESELFRGWHQLLPLPHR